MVLMFRGLRRLCVAPGMGGMVHGHGRVVMRRQDLNRQEASQGAKDKGEQDLFRLEQVRHFFFLWRDEAYLISIFASFQERTGSPQRRKDHKGRLKELKI